MDKALKRKITIETIDENDHLELGLYIHNQLVGNEDYINNNIILNVDDERLIKLYIFKECENIPQITLI